MTIELKGHAYLDDLMTSLIGLTGFIGTGRQPTDGLNGLTVRLHANSMSALRAWVYKPETSALP